MSQFLIIMLVQLLLVLLCVIAGVAFFNYRRRHDEELGAQMLVYHINSHKDLRIDSLTSLIEKVYGSQGEELKNIVDQLYLKEADCYRELIQVFMNRDPKQLTKMYDAVQKITAAYEGMLLQFNSESKDQSTVVKRVDHSQRSNVTNDISSPKVQMGSSTEKSVGAMMSTDTIMNEKANDSSLSYRQEVEGLSTQDMEVKVEGITTEQSPQSEIINSDADKPSAPINAEVINTDQQPAKAPEAEVLPEGQEMSYYQDKLMTYLESKEVNKGSVTDLLDKDNKKEVAK